MTTPTAEFLSKIQTFSQRFQEEQLAGLVARNLDCQGNRVGAQTSVKPGKVYFKVDIGGSGRFMIDIQSGTIYGIKAYGQVHKGHQYGTLDTTAEWNWSDYRPSRKA